MWAGLSGLSTTAASLMVEGGRSFYSVSSCWFAGGAPQGELPMGNMVETKMVQRLIGWVVHLEVAPK